MINLNLASKKKSATRALYKSLSSAIIAEIDVRNAFTSRNVAFSLAIGKKASNQVPVPPTPTYCIGSIFNSEAINLITEYSILLISSL